VDTVLFELAVSLVQFKKSHPFRHASVGWHPPVCTKNLGEKEGELAIEGWIPAFAGMTRVGSCLGFGFQVEHSKRGHKKTAGLQRFLGGCGGLALTRVAWPIAPSVQAR
jgi:hypothetical protein